MIRLPSYTKPYSEYWSEDPAFHQPPIAPSDEATEEVRKQHTIAVAEYKAKLTSALETGDWSGMRVEGGGEPTVFTVRVLSSDVLGKLSDRRNDGAGDYEFLTLVFRLALQSIAPFDGPRLEHVDDDELGQLVSLEWMEKAGMVGGVGLRLIREIGMRVYTKSVALSPK